MAGWARGQMRLCPSIAGAPPTEPHASHQLEALAPLLHDPSASPNSSPNSSAPPPSVRHHYSFVRLKAQTSSPQSAVCSLEPGA
ncbi:hypothetical protein TOPH_01329 [Tolypocladium ophioglossoides CBS 100239]|uniref:Uncharacterized protein n=1 Tax=Tolypocladium ophioglossoides (strain CBS 100239) TaxID=1163406 RepID=A0A0L0NLG2_TOLOC|nr:hypothetical protein TOPH_01329 [Tolypocladium ophioglossoides CBS 100239]